MGSRAAEPHAQALKEEILSFVEVFAEVRVCRVMFFCLCAAEMSRDAVC